MKQNIRCIKCGTKLNSLLDLDRHTCINYIKVNWRDPFKTRNFKKKKFVTSK